MAEIVMPRLSDSMEEGTIVRWLKADGDAVARDEEIVEIETDKATMSYEADASGTLAIVVAEGATVPVGAAIARIEEPGRAGGGAEPAAPAAAAAPVEAAAPAASVTSAAPAPPRTGRASASPVARRLAASLGVAIEAVQGSGRRGRVLKADVRAAASGAPEANGAARAAVAPPVEVAAAETIKGAVAVAVPTRLQQTVARRMSESKATVPDFAVEVDVDMTAAVALRAQLKELTERPPSLNDLVVAAAARALRDHPRVNGSFRDGRFETYERVNVGVAVATKDGLVVPTVLDADRRSLGEVAAEVRRLAARVRSGEITPPELAGGTFTVSNLGMFGVDRFAGVVNPPQAAILCVGAVARRPAVGPDGEIVAREQLSLTLVSDHRILYGADAARFLVDLRARLEAPLGVLI